MAAVRMRPLPLALAGLLLTAGTAPGQRASTAETEGSAPAGALQAALLGARAGDTIRVPRGVHPGDLRITAPVVLIGEEGATIRGSGRGSIVTVAADSVELIGLALESGGRSLESDDAAVKLVRCTGCRIERVRIERALHGIFLLESSGVEIEDVSIVGDTTLAEARRGNGIHLFHSQGNRLAGNTVRRTRDGIYFSFSSGNRVERNDVREVRYGLHYMYSDDNRFRGNTFARNAAGAAIMFSKRIVFRDNRFLDHVGYRAYGILLQTSEQITAEGNRIEGNLIGLFLDNATGNTIRGNVIAGNGVGVDLLSSAESNVFHGNVITGNRTAVRKAFGGGINQWAVQGRGNYWGDRGVFDLDGDGVAERPHAASDPFATLAASRPALEIFVGTPAARLLSWAERAFPVFDLPTASDPAPLTRSPVDGAPAATRRAGYTAGAGIAVLALLLAVTRRMRPNREGRIR